MSAWLLEATSSHQLRLFQEIQTEFPSWRRRPEEPSRERHSIFEERGGRGVGEKVTHTDTHTQKTKTVAVPGMCLGEPEPSLPSHPQLCWPGPCGGAGGAGQDRVRTPAASLLLAGRAPCHHPVRRSRGMTRPQVRAQPPDTPWAEGPQAPLRLVLNFMTSFGEVLKQGHFSTRVGPIG